LLKNNKDVTEAGNIDKKGNACANKKPLGHSLILATNDDCRNEIQELCNTDEEIGDRHKKQQQMQQSEQAYSFPNLKHVAGRTFLQVSVTH